MHSRVGKKPRAFKNRLLNLNLPGTPLDFARHAKHEEMIKYLSSMEGTGKSKTGYSSTTHPEMQNGAFKRRTSVGSAASGGRGSNKGREQSLPPGGRRL